VEESKAVTNDVDVQFVYMKQYFDEQDFENPIKNLISLYFYPLKDGV
jgi:hypothetical protein